jgi:malonate-semialdehyde dehydrogenase (acetylating)/methylmalonate-semialdehyde dehydrogenase
MLRLPRYFPRNLRYASTAAAASTSSSAKFAPLAMKAAEEVSTKWKGTTANGGKTKNYIGGEFVDSSAKKWLEVRDPVCLLQEGWSDYSYF